MSRNTNSCVNYTNDTIDAITELIIKAKSATRDDIKIRRVDAEDPRKLLSMKAEK